jgi:hypothetical protein
MTCHARKTCSSSNGRWTSEILLLAVGIGLAGWYFLRRFAPHKVWERDES